MYMYVHVDVCYVSDSLFWCRDGWRVVCFSWSSANLRARVDKQPAPLLGFGWPTCLWMLLESACDSLTSRYWHVSVLRVVEQTIMCVVKLSSPPLSLPLPPPHTCYLLCPQNQQGILSLQINYTYMHNMKFIMNAWVACMLLIAFRGVIYSDKDIFVTGSLEYM